MKPPAFSAGQLESICQILAETIGGLTGSEIERLLTQVKVPDTDPGMTKWKRLHNALAHAQNAHGHGGRVLAFITAAMDPARYVGRHDLFEDRRGQLNAVLALCGLDLRDDAKFYRVAPARTLAEAEQRAHRLRAALSARGVHRDVIASCRAELVQNNCFHAVLEASKGVAEKIRVRCALTSDGAPLVDEALSGDDPRMRINAFRTDSERSEQRGFVNLLKGLFGTFRNPTAHTLRTEWPLSEEDALDLFSLASYTHRRIDGATVR
jgi:uncharacterized protein (TIGR02391 family)